MAKKKPLNYFYINDKLHKKLSVNRPADLIVTWCYPDHKRVTYTYSDVMKRKEPAFSTKEVCKMLNRSRVRIELAILDGGIESPQYTYGLSGGRKHSYLWSEKDIMNAHDYFLTVHRGRPRMDGRVIPQQMPTKRELRAMIRQEQVLYIKDEHGEFKPVWKAPDLS